MVNVEAAFDSDVREHELQIIRDDGLYRHLRCKQPESYMYGFDIVTWPGYLAIVGDCGDFVFSRVRDMFDFFRSEAGWRINPDYWSQKLQAPRPEKSREFSHDAFKRTLMDWADDQCEDFGCPELLPYPSLIRGAIEREVFTEDPYVPYDGMSVEPGPWSRHFHNFEEARQAIEDLDAIPYSDYCEWWEAMREYDFRFLWCCHAIVWAIERYRVEVGVTA